MEIKLIRLSDIVEDDFNPRKALTPDDPEYQKIKHSLLAFGSVEPIVFNTRTHHIVGGHQRITVLAAEGHTEVEASLVDLDEQAEKLLNISLNKIKGRWDYGKLEEILSSFDPEEARLTGFGPEEIAVILAKSDDIEDPFEGLEWGDSVECGEDGGLEGFVGASWVVSLKFENFEYAQQWMLAQDFPNIPTAGKNTTVVRMR